MPATATELYGVRLSGQRAERAFKVVGTTDAGEAKAALIAAAGSAYEDIDINADECEVEEVATSSGGGAWLGRVQYGVSTGGAGRRKDVGEQTFSFRTGGGTQHLTQSLSTIGRYAPDGMTAKDHKGAIGVAPDGSVTGVDVVARQFAFTITKVYAPTSLTAVFVGRIYAATARYNNASVSLSVPGGETLTFPEGELLLVDVSSSERADGNFELTFSFLGSDSVEAVTVNGITTETKLGHDYLWFQYAGDVDTSANGLATRPGSVYIERVYKSYDFSLLGLS